MLTLHEKLIDSFATLFLLTSIFGQSVNNYDYLLRLLCAQANLVFHNTQVILIEYKAKSLQSSPSNYFPPHYLILFCILHLETRLVLVAIDPFKGIVS